MRQHTLIHTRMYNVHCTYTQIHMHTHLNTRKYVRHIHYIHAYTQINTLVVILININRYLITNNF